MIHQVRNHLTVETRSRRTSLGNIGFGIQIKPRRKTYTVIPRTSSSSLTNYSFSLWKRCFGLDIPPVKYHLASETRVVLQTDGTISSPHLGFGIQIIPRRKVLKAHTRMDDIRITSEKVLNCYHDSQQLGERTRLLSFGFS